MNIKHIALISIFLCIPFAGDLHSCTMFYCAKDGIILAGNNEDWEDPVTKLWIYPPGPAKHGWIKFGFGNGFPQGGMNDQGVFWDATAGPYKEMPYSESNKTFYTGVLMQKVIEECSNVEEAKKVLQEFYSQDQYRAQYLIGDALGSSMIAEGDSFLMKQGDYQVLTNFYQSDPQLGGYPCMRYQTAKGLLADCDTLTPFFVGKVLASTFQDGRYPTQYSNIYDLINKRVYLFYFHNYKEFLEIDLMTEMEKGEQCLDIPSLFSQMGNFYPGNGDTVAVNEVILSWSGLPESEYRIIYARNPELSDPVVVEAPGISAHTKFNASFAIFLPVLVLLGLMRGRRNRIYTVLILIIVMSTGIHCEKENDPDNQKNLQLHSIALPTLEPDTNYYWKIEAVNPQSGSFTSETIVYSFRTGGNR